MHKLPIHNIANVGTGKERVFKLHGGVLSYYTNHTGVCGCVWLCVWVCVCARALVVLASLSVWCLHPAQP